MGRRARARVEAPPLSEAAARRAAGLGARAPLGAARVLCLAPLGAGEPRWRAVDPLLARMPALEEVDLAFHAIERVEHLGRLARLRVLNLSENRIAALEPDVLRGLGCLELLNLNGNLLRRIPALGALPALKVLRLARNLLGSLDDVDRLAGLPALASLSLHGNPMMLSELDPSSDSDSEASFESDGPRAAPVVSLASPWSAAQLRVVARLPGLELLDGQAVRPPLARARDDRLDQDLDLARQVESPPALALAVRHEPARERQRRWREQEQGHEQERGEERSQARGREQGQEQGQKEGQEQHQRKEVVTILELEQEQERRVLAHNTQQREQERLVQQHTHARAQPVATDEEEELVAELRAIKQTLLHGGNVQAAERLERLRRAVVAAGKSQAHLAPVIEAIEVRLHSSNASRVPASPRADSESSWSSSSCGSSTPEAQPRAAPGRPLRGVPDPAETCEPAAGASGGSTESALVAHLREQLATERTRVASAQAVLAESARAERATEALLEERAGKLAAAERQASAAGAAQQAAEASASTLRSTHAALEARVEALAAALHSVCAAVQASQSHTGEPQAEEDDSLTAVEDQRVAELATLVGPSLAPLVLGALTAVRHIGRQSRRLRRERAVAELGAANVVAELEALEASAQAARRHAAEQTATLHHLEGQLGLAHSLLTGLQRRRLEAEDALAAARARTESEMSRLGSAEAQAQARASQAQERAAEAQRCAAAQRALADALERQVCDKSAELAVVHESLRKAPAVQQLPELRRQAAELQNTLSSLRSEVAAEESRAAVLAAATATLAGSEPGSVAARARAELAACRIELGPPQPQGQGQEQEKEQEPQLRQVAAAPGACRAAAAAAAGAAHGAAVAGLKDAYKRALGRLQAAYIGKERRLRAERARANAAIADERATRDRQLAALEDALAGRGLSELAEVTAELRHATAALAAGLDSALARDSARAEVADNDAQSLFMAEQIEAGRAELRALRAAGDEQVARLGAMLEAALQDNHSLRLRRAAREADAAPSPALAEGPAAGAKEQSASTSARPKSPEAAPPKDAPPKVAPPNSKREPAAAAARWRV
jgi:hypothetical protein